jgi:3',5'-cyclic AMP phosphodiesterase CpdA
MLVADPQFGLHEAVSPIGERIRPSLERQGLKLPYFSSIEGLEREHQLFTEAIDAANRIRPDFVVVCGDMVQKWDDDSQAAAIKAVAARAEVPVQWVAGNHDVAEDAFTPTQRAIESYRQRFGRDFYSFDLHSTRFIVLNSTVLMNPDALPEEFGANISLLEECLDGLADAGCVRCVIFSHHPWFLEQPEEFADYPIPMAVPLEVRRELLQIVRRPEVLGVFAGHTHRTQEARHGNLEMVQTVAAGLPFGDEPAGYRIVEVYERGLNHFGVPLATGVGFAWESRRLEYELRSPPADSLTVGPR